VLFILNNCDNFVSVNSLSNDQGEVYIRGRKRDGLISDDEISGLRIGLVSFIVICNMLILKGCQFKL